MSILAASLTAQTSASAGAAGVVIETGRLRMRPLRDGDLVDILSAGAYTTAYAAPGFNGFPAPSEHYI